VYIVCEKLVCTACILPPKVVERSTIR